MSQTEAVRRLEVTQGAVSQWVARARQGGEDALKTQPRSGRPPRLSADMVPRVLAALEALGPEGFGYDDQRWTTQRIADAIARLTHIRYSTSKISDLLRQWDWTWQIFSVDVEHGDRSRYRGLPEDVAALLTDASLPRRA